MKELYESHDYLWIHNINTGSLWPVLKSYFSSNLMLIYYLLNNNTLLFQVIYDFQMSKSYRNLPDISEPLEIITSQNRFILYQICLVEIVNVNTKRWQSCNW